LNNSNTTPTVEDINGAPQAEEESVYGVVVKKERLWREFFVTPE
jgi:hypothetical protein